MKHLFVKIAFVITFLMVLISAIAKIVHSDNADTYLLMSLIPSYLCFGYVTDSIFTSQKLRPNSKALWVTGLFLVGWPIMLLYVFATNKKRKATKGLRTT